jgi:hypothetical protein
MEPWHKKLMQHCSSLACVLCLPPCAGCVPTYLYDVLIMNTWLVLGLMRWVAAHLSQHQKRVGAMAFVRDEHRTCQAHCAAAVVKIWPQAGCPVTRASFQIIECDSSTGGGYSPQWGVRAAPDAVTHTSCPHLSQGQKGPDYRISPATLNPTPM